ncbi:MAG: 50S ribosomal protein L25 [Chloroflexi bacterium]|nr:50S ribosomal protein L25 [Chloroflexota bacterium]
MEKVVLKAEKRNAKGKKVGALRRAGKLPAVIYGRHLEPVAIELEAHSAGLTLGKLSSSSLVTIELEGREYPSLVREKQRNFIKGDLTHVDFLAVDLTEKIRAKVRIELVGVAAAVKDFNAVLVRGSNSIEVECLPTDLPERITVDIAPLAQIGNGIYVRDVVLPPNLRVLNDEDEMIAVATAPKVEAVEAAPVVPEVGVVEPAEPELSVERGKKVEEGGEEAKGE